MRTLIIDGEVGTGHRDTTAGATRADTTISGRDGRFRRRRSAGQLRHGELGHVRLAGNARLPIALFALILLTSSFGAWAAYAHLATGAKEASAAVGQRRLGGLSRSVQVVAGDVQTLVAASTGLTVLPPDTGSLLGVGRLRAAAFVDVTGPTLTMTSSQPADDPTLSVLRDRSPAVGLTFDLATDAGGRPVASSPIATPQGVVVVVASARYSAGPPPLSVPERRARSRGFLAIIVNPAGVLDTLVPDGVRTPPTELSDAGEVLAGTGRPTSGVVGSVAFFGRTWTIAVGLLNTSGDRAVPAGIVGGGIVIALVVSLVAAAFERRRHAADRLAERRATDLELVASVGPLLQESLDLGEILPGFCVRLAEAMDLEEVRVLLVNEDGRMAEIFRVGEATARASEVRMPLLREGRVIGSLNIVPAQSLDRSAMSSLAAATDLLAAAVVNARLYQKEIASVQRLEELDRLKTSFLGTVSHELRTPVVAIGGFADLLTSEWDSLSDAGRRDFLSRIGRNAQSLQLLIDDLLDFARLERDSLQVNPRSQPLASLVQSVIEQMSASIPGRHIETELDPSVGAAVDDGAVERIVVNLVSNAAKFSPAASTITVTVDAAGGKARLVVADEGPGVAPEDEAHIWSRFYRGDSDAARATRGAGIGLAVVRELVDLSHGSVTVERPQRGGARFVVLFPQAEGDADDRAS